MSILSPKGLSDNLRSIPPYAFDVCFSVVSCVVFMELKVLSYDHSQRGRE